MGFAPWILLSILVGLSHGYHDPHCDGKQVLVEMFEWKWVDVAQECERFLGPAGYCGVQISPPHEHIWLPDEKCPWWQRYQVASYKLESRSGTRAEFIDMVQRCNAAGVRIIADSIVNHAAGMDRVGPGYAGTDFDTTGGKHDFPAIPYSDEHFTPREMCPSDSGSVDNYSVADNVRNCYLVGLSDLYGANSHVQQMVADYYNDLIDIGVAGFRVDAAKHMWPEDIAAIQALLNPLNTKHGFKQGSLPFFVHEVIDRDDGVVRVQEYYDLGLVTEFRYSQKIAWATTGDWGQYGGMYDPGWGMSDPEYAFVFVDNHDNQRGHGGAGDVVTFMDGKQYAYATSMMLATEYGFSRVMSSYEFENSDQGPPSDANFGTNNVPINEDGSCGGGWVCEHRWNPIAKMVQFSNAVAGAPQDHFWSDGDSAGLARVGKGFFAMTQRADFSKSVQTGLPAGDYCNIIDSCASSVSVAADGTADISITNPDGILAICVSCSGEFNPGTTGSPMETSPADDTTTTDASEDSTTTTEADEETTTVHDDTTADPGPTNCCSEILFDSTGPSMDHYPEAMGTYQIEGVDSDGYPFYSHEASDYHLYFLNDFAHHYKGWAISMEAGSPTTMLSREGDAPCIEGLNEGWEYWLVDDWLADTKTDFSCLGEPAETTPGSDLSTTDSGPSSTAEPSGDCCAKVAFSATGALADDMPEVLGSYAQEAAGSNVYVHEAGTYYLYFINDFAHHFNGWLISEDPASDTGLISMESDVACVEDGPQTWEYFLINEWNSDDSAEIACATSN
eukprot:maker-scaffold367_size194084-snap-gene-0.49 protein:Tk00508 transcript:maker-scaffold367_size194084-snap-gene-0.49-mRNA-1 annotation:"hypothetical protein DAPPUDRAFT_64687"